MMNDPKKKADKARGPGRRGTARTTKKITTQKKERPPKPVEKPEVVVKPKPKEPERVEVIPVEVVDSYRSGAFRPVVQWCNNQVWNLIGAPLAILGYASLPECADTAEKTVDIGFFCEPLSDLNNEEEMLRRLLDTGANDCDLNLYEWKDRESVIDKKLKLMEQDSPEAASAVVDLAFRMADDDSVEKFEYPYEYEWQGRKMPVRYTVKWVIGRNSHSYAYTGEDGSGWKWKTSEDPEEVRFEPARGEGYVCLKLAL